MRIVAFLLVFQWIASCQQVPEINLIAETATATPSTDTARKGRKNTPPSETNLVMQSTDGGHSWQDAGAGLPKGLPVGGIFAIGNQLFLSAEHALYRTGPETLIWEKEAFMDENFVDFFPGRAGTYAYSHPNGLFQEKLPGIWEPVYTDLNNKSVRTILETPDGTIFVGSDNGIFKSADAGKTWKQVFNEGMVLNIVASNGVLIAGGFKGLLRSADGGEHWNWVLTEGGVGIETQIIGGGIAAITYNGEMETRRVRTSADGGLTWKPIDAGLLPSLSIFNLKQAGKYLFCSHPFGIFRSSDEGKSWELIRAAPEGMMFGIAVSGNVVYAIKSRYLGGC